MASRITMTSRAILISLFLVSVFLPYAAAEVICEELPQDLCAFAISSASKRCILENGKNGDGKMEYQCRTSDVVVARMSDLIETDECIRACGLERTVVGISSDAFLDSQFARKLCSPSCYSNCPNIVDLYFNLAAAEGAYLPDLCDAHRSNPHRSMISLLSSGAAQAPTSASLFADAVGSSPAPSPSA